MEVPEEPVGDTVPTPPWGPHRGQQLDVHETTEGELGAVVP